MDGSAVVSTAAVSTGQGKTFGVLKVPTGGSLACKGTNSLTQHVWGFVLSLDTCNLAKFEEQTKTVGIVSGFLGIVLNQDPKLKIIVGAALALIGVGLLALNRCSKPGRGVRVYKGWAAPAQIWCKSQ